MNLTENSDEIIIRHTPFRKWIIGAILILIFSALFVWFIYSVVNGSSNLFEIGTYEFLGIFPILFFWTAIILIIVFDIRLNSLMFAPMTVITINEKTKSIDIFHRRFYGSIRQRYYFHQIKKFKSYKSSLNFSMSYFLALILINQKEIKLKVPIGEDKQDIIKVVKKLNKFMKLKDLQKNISDQ